MKAKNIRANRVSVEGSNVVQVRNWRLLTEVVLASGERLSFHPEQSVKVMPARDADGKFQPREYLLMMVIDGVDTVVSYTGRNMARRWKKIWADAYGVTPLMVAI